MAAKATVQRDMILAAMEAARFKKNWRQAQAELEAVMKRSTQEPLKSAGLSGADVSLIDQLEAQEAERRRDALARQGQGVAAHGASARLGGRKSRGGGGGGGGYSPDPDHSWQAANNEGLQRARFRV